MPAPGSDLGADSETPQQKPTETDEEAAERKMEEAKRCVRVLVCMQACVIALKGGELLARAHTHAYARTHLRQCARAHSHTHTHVRFISPRTCAQKTAGKNHQKYGDRKREAMAVFRV